MTPRTSSGILAEIVQQKKQELADLHANAEALEQAAYERVSHVRSFAAALRQKTPAVIAEIKKASPSKGLLQPNFHPAFIAGAYQEGGAACLSVLTDKEYFSGSLQDLEAARAASTLPVLRKDFTVDRLQVFEAAAHGADAILLIAAILDTEQLTAFRELASSLSLAALVEVHNEEDLAKAIDSGAEIIGVNNRNLDTFQVTLDTSLRLSERLPADAVRISESGIFSRADVDMLLNAGFHGFLIGESLMKSENPASTLKTLIGDD
ncbi:MAG TPA: indole-3-glycerol phosphate synthase TrpC [Bryobacteraceae bacterium]|nr:indole-3-glycerol phosphate synthase TrpC [Bryobacteraceae bacterium]